MKFVVYRDLSDLDYFSTYRCLSLIQKRLKLHEIKSMKMDFFV